MSVRTTGRCRNEDCSALLQSKYQWEMGRRLDGHRPHAGHGFCKPCNERRLRTGTTQYQPPHGGRRREGPDIPRAELLEDYGMIREDVSSVREAAKRLGVSFHCLDRALYRARLDGVEGAMPPPDQVNRALSRGMKYRSAA